MIDEIMVRDFTANGKCSNCGKCCSNCLPLSEAEIKRIKAYIKRHGIKEQRHNFASGVDMTCPFRDERNKNALSMRYALLSAESLCAIILTRILCKRSAIFIKQTVRYLCEPSFSIIGKI